jgi:biopolymer transport protein ExbD
MVIVSADDKNKVGQVVNLLDSAKQAGALKVAILKNDSPPVKG